MNKDLFESQWKNIRALSPGWWGLMSNFDLEKVDKAEVKFDKVVTMLQVKYGYTRDQARKEIAKRMTEYETAQKAGL